MMHNQYHFEVIRDLIKVIGELKEGESVAISVQRHGQDNTGLLDWETSKGECYGSSETSQALKKAYTESTGIEFDK